MAELLLIWPALPADACTPDLPRSTRDHLLAWHEQLADVCFVTPWER